MGYIKQLFEHLERYHKGKNMARLIKKHTTPRSIYTSTIADSSNISYEPYRSTHIFTKVNLIAPKSTD
jgi:hypothetical protein